MARMHVTAEQLTIHPHPNAHRLEVAQVGLYRSVVAKDAYRTGDWAVYIPEGSVLPDDLIAELGLTGKLAGRARNRVVPRWLRGEFSQGIVCRPKALASVDLAAAHADGHNFAEALRITRWAPRVPIHLSGEVVGAPELMPWMEIEDIKRYPDVFQPGERVVATEKIHGTACLYTWADGDDYVSSKGNGRRRLAFVRDDANLYWRTVLTYALPRAAGQIAMMMTADRVGIFGEIYGKGVQDLTYGADAICDRPGYAVFDVRVETEDLAWWLDPDELVDVNDHLDEPLPLVPRLFDGRYDQDLLLALAEGRETVSGSDQHLREGLVVRPATERRSSVLGGRAIAKAVSAAYLTRIAGSEYE